MTSLVPLLTDSSIHEHWSEIVRFGSLSILLDLPVYSLQTDPQIERKRGMWEIIAEMHLSCLDHGVLRRSKISGYEAGSIAGMLPRSIAPSSIYSLAKRV